MSDDISDIEAKKAAIQTCMQTILELRKTVPVEHAISAAVVGLITATKIMFHDQSAADIKKELIRLINDAFDDVHVERVGGVH